METHHNTQHIAPKRIAVLGATGSIGTQAIDIIARHPELYRATVVSGGNRAAELAEAALRVRPLLAVIANEAKFGELRQRLEPHGIACAAGADAIAAAAAADCVDMVLTATVGYSGLAPTVAAIKAGKDIALANKETLVVAGDFVNSLLKASKSTIYPVDSEHSAIAQCLAGEDRGKVSRLIVTASGGPFRTFTAEQMEKATPADALRHPNWSMGAKITIDSATMMNKAFELIEAHHLFGVDPDRISAVVHPQSIVHSMVEFADGAIKAQLGVPDMRLPIAYALGCHSRLPGASRSLTLAEISSLTFEAPDPHRFPCLTLAHTAMERRGTCACTINAANEIAVDAFLKGRIGFTDIYRLIEATLGRAFFVAAPSYPDYVECNDESRRIAQDLINKL